MKKRKFPYIADPHVHEISGQPDSCWDMVNKYGTYEIQPTQDADNTYPTIAQGYPTDADPADPWNENP
ncbi:MAG: hypothetical protein VB055_08060 [Oscillospiraceae bacterium]|nr:hypothetical protein [Oscillospiraceae bacterium]